MLCVSVNISLSVDVALPRAVSAGDHSSAELTRRLTCLNFGTEAVPSCIDGVSALFALGMCVSCMGRDSMDDQ